MKITVITIEFDREVDKSIIEPLIADIAEITPARVVISAETVELEVPEVFCEAQDA